MSLDDADPVDTPDPVSLLYLPPITLAADAPQLLEIEWHPTRPMLATTDVEGAVCFYEIAGLVPKPRRGAPVSKHAPHHTLLAKLEYHKESCRSIVFHPSGQWAYTCSADKSIGIIDLRTLTLAAHIQNAHEAGINRLAFFDENILVSGDDDGFVHVWDLRAQNMSTNAAATAAANKAAGASAASASGSAAAAGRPAKSAQPPKPASKSAASASSSPSSAAAPYGSALYPLLRYEDCGDYISDILPIADKNRMVITSGDGHLYVYDMRPGHMHEKLAQAYGTKALPKPKPLGKSKKNQNKKLTPSGFMRNGFAVDTWFAMSDDVADELAGSVLLKRGRKLVAAGREEGVLNIFRWDFFGKAQDHFSLGATDNEMEGSGASIDCMVKIDEDTIVTGSTDGLIRLVQVHPNKLVAILGTHEDFPVESMKMSPERDAYFDLTKAKGSDEVEEESDEEEEEAEAEEKEEDEEESDDEDASASSKSSTAAPSKPSGPLVLPSDSHASAQSILGSSLLPRFLASCSHDGVVKFWNCSELYEVDPDEEKPEDSDDEEAEEEGVEGKEGASDADSDDDEKQAEIEAEASMKKQSKKAAAPKRKRTEEPDGDEDDEEKEDAADEEDDNGEDMSDESGVSNESADEGEGVKAEGDEADAKPVSKKSKKLTDPAASKNPFAGIDLSAFAKVAPSSAAAAPAPASMSSNPFARIAPAAAAAAPATAAASPAPPVTNAWLLVAPATAPTRSPRDAKGGAGSDDSDSDLKPRREKKVLNADSRDATFFANLPANHPMHPANQHKRLNKAPLVVEVDNIAKRPAKKLAALQEKLRIQRETKARREARRAEAVAKGEDPDLVSDSEDEDAAQKKGKGKGKGKSKLSARAVGSDDDSDADSDDSDGGGAKPVKERKLTSKEKKALKKAERKKNPFFSGL